MRMYKSPIDIIYGQMETQMEGDILRAIQRYGINVDKGELLRALQYDRGQYEKGYADGKKDAMAELVRCKDCNRAVVAVPPLVKEEKLVCTKSVNWRTVESDHFCSYGERREGE
jgi:hypothetical protein